jgi:hypothetical protein
MLDSILEQRSKGNPTIRMATKTKLILKGLDPERFSAATADDLAVIAKVRAIAAEWGLAV